MIIVNIVVIFIYISFVCISYAYDMVWYDPAALYYVCAYHVHNIKILISIYAYIKLMYINTCILMIDVCIISRLKLLIR